MENQRWPRSMSWRAQQYARVGKKDDPGDGDYFSQPHDNNDADNKRSPGPLSRLDQLRRSQGFTSSRVSLRERLLHFTWCWFECTMSTGALAALLGFQEEEQPFYDDSTRHLILRRAGQGFFILDVLLFGLFFVLISVRFMIRPAALKASLHHPHESFFYGTFWVSLALLLEGLQEYGVPWITSLIGGGEPPSWLHQVIEALFWIYAAGALQLVIFQYHVIFDEERLPIVQEAMPTWILPAYPFIIMGPLAAVILSDNNQQPGQDQSAKSMLIGGIVFAGLGWSLAFIMYTVYFTRLISGALPKAKKRPDMFVAVGPAGYTATTLSGLGMQAPKVVPATYLGITSGVPTGDLWKAMSVPAAMFIWMVGFWFFAQAAVSTLRGARRMRFTLSWWAFIFPNAGLTLGMAHIGQAIDSAVIRDAVVPAATAILVAVWLLVAVMNVWAVWRGDVLWPGKDEDMEYLIDESNGNGGSKAGHDD
ncbi:hypothetical protein PG996_007320 [Apiospora saccharicola]|uniref:Malic acid transport protein n=1 Tax=Apiospora saccharicola TaxID=335842 RepID=A0ABR1VE59_9PEZI